MLIGTTAIVSGQILAIRCPIAFDAGSCTVTDSGVARACLVLVKLPFRFFSFVANNQDASSCVLIGNKFAFIYWVRFTPATIIAYCVIANVRCTFVRVLTRARFRSIGRRSAEIAIEAILVDIEQRIHITPCNMDPDGSNHGCYAHNANCPLPSSS